MMVDGVHVRLATSRDLLIFRQRGFEALPQIPLFPSKRDYSLELLLIEHGHLGPASPTPEHSHDGLTLAPFAIFPSCTEHIRAVG
jgi:hypothetical protein